MPISYEHIHTNFLETGESTTVAEILLIVLAIPQEERRDLYLIVALDPDGYAVMDMNDLNEALKSKGESTLDGPVKDILDLPKARSKTVERRKQGYKVARNKRDQSYKNRLVVLELGKCVGLLVHSPLAPGEDFSRWLEQAIPGANQRFVNVDFASLNDPANPLNHSLPLQPDQTYYFYLEIGDTLGGLDEKPVPLPDLPADAELDVVVFGYPKGLQVLVGSDRGRIKLNSNGTSSVIKPAEEPSLLLDSPVLRNRLYFSVITPSEPEEYRLRCLIYYQQALVQARIISALVGTEPDRRKIPAIRSHIDYTLSHTLDPAKLSRMAETRLSLFMNDNKDGTHTIAINGRDLPEKPPLHLREETIKYWVKNIRGDMREATWGDRENYTGASEIINRYEITELGNLNKLQEDLIRMAISGHWIYDHITSKLGSGAEEELARLIQKPSEIQFSAVENITSVVPVAAIYDHLLDSSYAHDPTKYELCNAFKNAFKQKASLEDTDCFKGKCPNRGDGRIVCPSGFWGYRHNLGLPVSVGQAPYDAPTVISSTTPNEVAVALSSSADLTMRDKHQDTLSEIQADWDFHDSHENVIEMLQQTESQIVYFYCHGGFDAKSNAPFLSFDPDPYSGPRFYPTELKNKKIIWPDTKPLVFINGCYTTALDPEKTLNFVDRFVQFSRASGVIGTEITIFESTAMMFSKEFFKRFLILRQSVGDAVRGARLHMLEEGSPFGLVYIPFVLPGLHLENIDSHL